MFTLSALSRSLLFLHLASPLDTQTSAATSLKVMAYVNTPHKQMKKASTLSRVQVRKTIIAKNIHTVTLNSNTHWRCSETKKLKKSVSVTKT